jgi:hypothetical protein
MTRSERVVRGAISSDHIVQFFDTPASLAEGVATVLSPAVRERSPFLIVARPQHSKAILRALHALECPVASARRDGLLTIRDADETLAGFIRDGRPDPELFHKSVGALVQTLANRSGHLRIYGEMVDILAAQGNCPAAHRLEELWNELAELFSVTLLCGYSAAHFATDTTRETLAAICGQHTHAQPARNHSTPGEQIA